MSDSLLTLPVTVGSVLAQGRACVAASRTAIAASRSRIAASRRRLNPYFEISGGGEPSLCGGPASPPTGVVRAMLARGALFPINGHAVAVHARSGTGQLTCAVCQGPIATLDIEYSVVACHFHCFTVWRAESLGMSGAAEMPPVPNSP